MDSRKRKESNVNYKLSAIEVTLFVILVGKFITLKKIKKAYIIIQELRSKWQ